MKISLNIQSYRRAGNVLTLGICPGANLWVHEFEEEEYRKECSGTKIKVLSDDLKGNLPRVKNHILEIEEGNDVIVFLDDDIKYIGYWEKKERRKIEGERMFLQFIQKYSELARTWGMKLWGINLNPDKQVYREYSPFSTLSYISSSFACFLKGNELRYDERFPLKEDYDMTIQQLNRYRKVLRVNKFFYEKLSAENVGGCSLYRNYKREREQLILLQRKWGGEIVKVDENKRSHNLKKKKVQMDFNPIVNVPIKGI